MILHPESPAWKPPSTAESFFAQTAKTDLPAFYPYLALDPSFRSSYSTKMRGGFLRFQAQYLRRIRILDWRCVPEQLRVELVDAATKLDRQACDCAVFKLYSLSSKEKSVFEGGVE